MHQSAGLCSIETHKGFGPTNDHCNRAFDFTLYFEEVVLGIVPFFIILPFLVLRLYRLHKAPIVVGGTQLHLAKQGAYFLYGAAHILFLGAILMPDTINTDATIACSAITIVTTLALAITSHYEHYRNPRPSSPVSIFLVLTFVFECAKTRTLFGIVDGQPVALMALVATFIKFFLVLLEAKEKREWLLDPDRFQAPESTANYFNRLTFFWVNPLLFFGYKHQIQEADLFEVQKQIVGDREMLLLAESWDRYPNKSLPNSLFKLAFKHHWRSFASVTLPRMCFTAFNFSQPFLLQRTMKYLTLHNYANRPAIGNGLIAAYVLVYTGFGLTNALHQHRNYRSISKLRGSLIGVIYKKTMGMSSTALSESEAVTLMNADVERITVGLRQSQELYASLYEIPLALFLLHKQISWAALTPLGVIFFFTALAIGSSPKLAASQKTWLDKIQVRVDATASMLGSIKAVKMTGLGPDLGQRVRNFREAEISTARTFRSWLVKITTFSFASTSFSPVVALGTYILMAKYKGYPDLTLDKALTSLVLMNLLLEPVSFFIGALSGLINAMSCFGRIQLYLNTETKNDPNQYRTRHSLRTHYNISPPSPMGPSSEETPLNAPPTPSDYGMSPINGKPKFFDEYSVDGETIGDRYCITAEDACAGWEKEKPPILTNMNFKIREGTLTLVVGPVSSGKSTLLKAILGETTVSRGIQRTFYTEVAYCSQAAWLVNGTVRDNICHGAPYDPEWFDEVVRACDLETDIARMAQRDQTVIGSKGLGLSGGQQQRVALARAVYFRKSVVMIDDVLCGLDASTEDKVFQGVMGPKGLLRGTDTTVIYVTNAVHRLQDADYIIVLGTDGKIAEQGTFEQLSQGDGYVGHLDFAERAHVEEEEEEEEKLTIKKKARQSIVQIKEEEEIAEAKTAGDLTIYAYYISTFGWVKWIIFCTFCALYGFGTAFPGVWVKMWTTYNQDHPNEKIPYYLGMYLFFAVLGLSSLVVACWVLIMTMAPAAGRKLHENMLTTVLNAPMSFFATTDTGITTNRFSQDLELIDMELPVALIRTAMMFFLLVAQLLVIITNAKWIGIAMPAVLVIIYFLQVYYLRTSRRLRLLDIETKAFLGTQFLELLSGIVTVRAFQWENYHLKSFLHTLKKAQRPFYLLYCVQRWLNMVLDLIVGGMAILLVTVAVKTKMTVDPAMTGLALTNLVGFSQMLKQLITNWTLLETSMGALARIRSFVAEVESENRPGEDHSAPDHWPKFGGIEFREVVASHKAAKRPTLNNLSFAIPPGTKLALVGRSGSGKSSLIAALLRLMDITSGSIVIDGIDIATLPRQTVRSRLIALPQDPYILAGTVRENVDPLYDVDDDLVISALRKVQLDHLLDDPDIGLNAKLGTEMLSHGQCQLLCLARAMVRKGSILILDEATASVDVQTDALMQRIIRTEFKHHTIIAAAHRLDTIIDFDAVLVLDAGRILEKDNPANLLKQESTFRELYQIQTGNTTPWDAGTMNMLAEASDKTSLRSGMTGMSGVSVGSVEHKVASVVLEDGDGLTHQEMVAAAGVMVRPSIIDSSPTDEGQGRGRRWDGAHGDGDGDSPTVPGMVDVVVDGASDVGEENDLDVFEEDWESREYLGLQTPDLSRRAERETRWPGA